MLCIFVNSYLQLFRTTPRIFAKPHDTRALSTLRYGPRWTNVPRTFSASAAQLILLICVGVALFEPSWEQKTCCLHASMTHQLFCSQLFWIVTLIFKITNLLYSLKLINAIYFFIIFIIFCYNASHLVTDNPVFIAWAVKRTALIAALDKSRGMSIYTKHTEIDKTLCWRKQLGGEKFE